MVPPFKPVPPVMEVTLPTPQVEQDTDIGFEPSVNAPVVTEITPEPERVEVATE